MPFFVFAASFLCKSCSTDFKPLPEHPKKTDSIIQAFNNLKPANPKHFLDSAYQQFTPGIKDKLKKLNALMDFYKSSHAYDSALVYADSMLVTAQPAFNTAGYDEEYIKALFFKGDVLRLLNRFDASLECYYRAKTLIAQKPGLAGMYYGYYDRLAYSFYWQGNYADAAKNYKLALANTTSEKDPFLHFVYRQMFLDNLGLCYNNLGNTDSALFYYNQALAYINASGPAFTNHTSYVNVARAVVYGNLAQVLAGKGSDTLAEMYMKESIRINSVPGAANEEPEYMREKLAGFYIIRGKTDEALKVLADMKKWLDGNRGNTHEAAYYRLLAKATEKKGDYKAALESINNYLAIDDAAAETRKKNNASAIQHQLDFMEKTGQLASLTAEQNKQKVYTVLYITGIFTAFIITMLVFGYYRQSKNNVKRLLELNNQVRQKNMQMHSVLEVLEKSHRENTRMMKIIAHDLRNPVGAMISFMEMADSFTEDERKKMLPMLQKSGRGALNLIEELLYSHASTKELVKENIELGDLLQYCIDQLLPKAQEKNQAIHFDAVQIAIFADREKLWRVFSNLVTNAIKFSPAGGDIAVNVTRDNGNVVVTVADNGIGIPPAMKDKIFEVDEKVKRKGTDNEPSFGLGLYISSQIINAHGGKIWFESPAAGGTVFYVSLPLNAALAN